MTRATKLIKISDGCFCMYYPAGNRTLLTIHIRQLARVCFCFVCLYGFYFLCFFLYAFDTIGHNILSHRLEHLYGLFGTPLKWFRSYFSNRTQTVTANNKLLQPTLLNFGILQGSILGSILFILYTKPSTTLIRQHSISNQSFAGDTQHTIPGSRSNRHLNPKHTGLHFRCKDLFFSFFFFLLRRIVP